MQVYASVRGSQKPSTAISGVKPVLLTQSRHRSAPPSPQDHQRMPIPNRVPPILIRNNPITLLPPHRDRLIHIHIQHQLPQPPQRQTRKQQGLFVIRHAAFSLLREIGAEEISFFEGVEEAEEGEHARVEEGEDVVGFGVGDGGFGGEDAGVVQAGEGVFFGEREVDVETCSMCACQRGEDRGQIRQRTSLRAIHILQRSLDQGQELRMMHRLPERATRDDRDRDG